MFDMKATTLMRLTLFLMVYFSLTNLFITSTEEQTITTTMDFSIVPVPPEPETVNAPQEVVHEDQSLWQRFIGALGTIKDAILGGFAAIWDYLNFVADFWTGWIQRFIALLTFDIPFPESMMESESGRIMVTFIRGTVGTSVTTMLVLVILNFASLIASFLPFIGGK